ncbi:MAG: hypothetical protein GXY44_15640, partial [Phycisphaerales bacterium]|nr:hypothetical protein [Phycisphaerales bacterium]
VWHRQLNQVIFDNNILRIRFADEALADFICYQLAFGKGKRRLHALAAGSTSVAAIYWKDLEKLRIAVPPIEEQIKICQVMRQNDTSITNLQDEISSLEEMKKGLMQDLLTGRVRVKGVA